MSKHDQRQKWLLIGLLPGLAGIGGWAASRWMRRRNLRSEPVPRSKALVPQDQTPRIAVTGVKRDAARGAARETDTTRTPNPLEDRDLARTSAGIPEKPQKENAAVINLPAETQPEAESRAAGYALEPHTAETASFLVLLIPFVALAIAIAALAFYRTPVQSSVTVPGGNADRGKVYLQAWGCGSCHTISGVDGANGKVGPNLDEVGLHSFVAGHLANTPDNMIQWIMHPQQVSPGTGMPEMGVPEGVARDMAAYLYSLNSRQRSSSLNFNRR